MNITIVMVVRDEGYFLPLSLNNALKHADSVYVLDTGSKDSTMSVLQFYKGIVGERLQFEQRDFGGRFRFDNMATIDTRKGGSIATGAYREMDARNYALEQAESMKRCLIRYPGLRQTNQRKSVCIS